MNERPADPHTHLSNELLTLAHFVKESLSLAQQAAQRFAASWQKLYPKATQCLRADLHELLTFLQSPPLPPTALRTTNAIDRKGIV